MLKIENIETYGWEAAIRGMRNPKNSWHLSDSHYCREEECCDCFDGDTACINGYIIGEKDYKLMRTLADAGNDHGKFLRMIGVSLDITGPLYWWKEADTYKVGTVANSCSTMHKLTAKEFELDDFSHEHLTGVWEADLLKTIETLNRTRQLYLEGESKNKELWYRMIQLLPSSYNQKRTLTLNYAVLKNMYHARRDHKLDEWHTLCDEIKKLPCSELIIY